MHTAIPQFTESRFGDGGGGGGGGGGDNLATLSDWH
jgi:hypothetical protein